MRNILTATSDRLNFLNFPLIWDYENRLATASTRRQTARYRYDALGRRIQRTLTDSNQNTKFIYDGMDVVADDSGGVLTKYQNGLGIDNKLKLTSGSTARYFLADRLGSTVGLTDSSGNLSSSASYDSFGNSSNNLTTRYQYTGREFDNFTGLQYSRARWYDANLGRFISEDPIGFRGGDINIYSYVRNKPIKRKDPKGLDDGDMNPLSDNDSHSDYDYFDRLKEQSDDYWNQRAMPLSECTKSWMKKYFPDLDLGQIRTYSGIPNYVPSGKAGFTIGRDIFLDPNSYNPDSAGGMRLLGHELTHTRQFQESGNVWFITKYSVQSLLNGGYGHNVPLEKEAYDNEANIYSDLEARRKNNEIPCGCQQTIKSMK